jgi:predicted transcriptional regulator
MAAAQVLELHKEDEMSDEKKQFILAWESSKTRQEVANKLEITMEEVAVLSNWARRKGIPIKDYSKGFLGHHDLETFITVWEAANNVEEVALEFQTKVSTVQSAAYRLMKEGVNLRKFDPPKKKAFTDKEFITAHESARCVEDLADKLGVAQSTVRNHERRLKEAGLNLRELPTRRQVDQENRIDELKDFLVNLRNKKAEEHKRMNNPLYAPPGSFKST